MLVNVGEIGTACARLMISAPSVIGPTTAVGEALSGVGLGVGEIVAWSQPSTIKLTAASRVSSASLYLLYTVIGTTFSSEQLQL